MEQEGIALMELGQGFPEWTELGQDSGLDPLGMQRPIEVIYQSIVPGISTITLRYRYYSFFPFILRHYEENIRNPDPHVFRVFYRKCEALFALICTYEEPDVGITGYNWAKRTLDHARSLADESAVIDFTVGADPDADEKLRYLRNKGGAFGAIYATQMSEMGLVHFPKAGDPNPNPVCSDLALKLADAFASELGDLADVFFTIAADGKIPLSSLKAFEVMKPSRLKLGSAEHNLLTEIILGKLEKSSSTDMKRRSTLQMLLDVSDASRSFPDQEYVKWYWFENVPELHDGGSASEVSQLWFLYQACDLMRLAYETILSAALSLLAAAPRRRMTLAALTDELVGFAAVSDDESWDEFVDRITDGAATTIVRDHARAMLAAKDQGEIADQVRAAVSLIALLDTRMSGAGNLIDEELEGAEYFQSIRTELKFLDQIRSESVDSVVEKMIRERILKRHLWVASRKFRNQKAYTFLMELEESQLRYRDQFSVAPSSPRIKQALDFLRDIGLIDAGGITQLGRAELATA